MPKKVVMIDADEFDAINICLAHIRLDLNKIPDSHFKNEVERRVNQIEEILSLDD